MLSGLHFFAPCVVASGDIGDIVGPIIVFIVIAVQLMRAAKIFAKNKPGGQRPAPRPHSSQPDESLRDFLESLSGESRPGSKPLPESTPQVEAPPPVPPPMFVITRHTPAQPIPIVAQIVPDKPVPVKMTVPQRATRPAGSGRRLSDVIGRLGNRHLLREAIILREVLGPPLGERPRPPVA
jgi:hypothetical protein